MIIINTTSHAVWYEVTTTKWKFCLITCYQMINLSVVLQSSTILDIHLDQEFAIVQSDWYPGMEWWTMQYLLIPSIQNYTYRLNLSCRTIKLDGWIILWYTFRSLFLYMYFDLYFFKAILIYCMCSSIFYDNMCTISDIFWLDLFYHPMKEGPIWLLWLNTHYAEIGRIWVKCIMCTNIL